MRYSPVTATIFLMAAPTRATSECTFTAECHEAGVCADTTFSLAFRAGTGGPNEPEPVTDAETIGVAAGGNGQVACPAGTDHGAFPGPAVVTRHGPCAPKVK